MATSDSKVFPTLVAALAHDPDSRVYKVIGADGRHHYIAGASAQQAVCDVAKSLGFKVELCGVKDKYRATIEALRPPKPA